MCRTSSIHSPIEKKGPSFGFPLARHLTRPVHITSELGNGAVGRVSPGDGIGGLGGPGVGFGFEGATSVWVKNKPEPW